MLALVSLENLVPARHPLRQVKPVVDGILRELSPLFNEMYAVDGRQSVPPERLLKAMVLMAFYSVRSERMFCDQLQYNMLYRWFLDMDMMEAPFSPTTFTHNRERLLEHEVAQKFFGAVVALAQREGLASNEHFSVDGTLIQAWASIKSFRAKDGTDDGDSNSFGGFKGSKRTNDTHASTTDPDAKLFRKGRGKEAKLSFMGHSLMENRNGLLVAFEVTQATGTAERDAALSMVSEQRASRRLTLGADKAYDTHGFVAECRARGVTPHVAMNENEYRRSAIDARTTRHPGYAASMIARMLIEKPFGWMKQFGGMARTRFKGLPRTKLAATMTAAAHNLLRITKLLPPEARTRFLTAS